MRGPINLVLPALLLLAVVSLVEAKEPPLVEKHLHAGELVKGEQDLERALAAAPHDDELRFGLGALQFVRAIERLGQSFYDYGLKSEHANAPFLRLPVPENPDPAPIRYAVFRRILDDARRDLAAAEETLAGVTDPDVVLSLRLADVHLDLDGDGRPTDRFLAVLKKVMRTDFDFLKENPEFLVRFDRGDVAWLRAYCHLLAGMLDFWLAVDFERDFDSFSPEVFARPKRELAGISDEELKARGKSPDVIRFCEPARLGRARRHWVAVMTLNRETWKHIRTERDDDHEWLPNPRQTGVLRMPVNDRMIDAWLAGAAEMEALLNGDCVLPPWWMLGDRGGAVKGVNLKTLLDDPPAELEVDAFLSWKFPDKYMDTKRRVNVEVFFAIWRVFDDTTAFGYMAWFN